MNHAEKCDCTLEELLSTDPDGMGSACVHALQVENERLKKVSIDAQAECEEQRLRERAELEEENERLRAALIPAVEWMREDGCDCGTDEPGTCALCLALRPSEERS